MGETCLLAPLREYGEEDTTGRTDKNGRRGTNPQAEVRVSFHRSPDLAIDDFGAFSPEVFGR